MGSPLYWRQGVAFRALFRLDIASGFIGVEFPDLPRCVAGGRDFVQARDDAQRALDRWVDAASPVLGKLAPAAVRAELAGRGQAGEFFEFNAVQSTWETVRSLQSPFGFNGRYLYARVGLTC